MFWIKGRVPRTTFWFALAPLYFLIAGVLYLSFSADVNFVAGWQAVIKAIVTFGTNNKSETLALLKYGPYLVAMILIVIFYISFVFAVKRLHDRNRSGIWLLFLVYPEIFTLIAWGLLHFGILLNLGMGLKAAQFISVVAFVWLFIELGFFRGTKGGNRFGEDPLEGKNQTEPQSA